MVTAAVKNVRLHFDSFDDGADQHTITDMVEEINKVLKQRFGDAQPHLYIDLTDENNFDIILNK